MIGLRGVKGRKCAPEASAALGPCSASGQEEVLGFTSGACWLPAHSFDRGATPGNSILQPSCSNALH